MPRRGRGDARAERDEPFERLARLVRRKHQQPRVGQPQAKEQRIVRQMRTAQRASTALSNAGAGTRGAGATPRRRRPTAAAAAASARARAAGPRPGPARARSRGARVSHVHRCCHLTTHPSAEPVAVPLAWLRVLLSRPGTRRKGWSQSVGRRLEVDANGMKIWLLCSSEGCATSVRLQTSSSVCTGWHTPLRRSALA